MPGAERILDFSLGQAHLSLRHRQLVVRRDGLPDATIPMEEVAVVIMASRQVTCSLPALDALMGAGAAVMVCDEAMHPSGLMLPLAAHVTQTQRMIAQASASLPVKKRIWREIVVAKVRAQGSLLATLRPDSGEGDAGLFEMAARVRSGDPDNLEAQAAQRYWPRLFGDVLFRRQRHAPDQNRPLNYGYAVLRAAVARAVVAVGLHPSLGVHHHNRYNAFCLADDLMEPYRPVIDGEVAQIWGEVWGEVLGGTGGGADAGEERGADVPLDPPVKKRLASVLHERMVHRGESRTVVEWIGRSASSLARCLTAEKAGSEKMFFPDSLVNP